MSAPPGRSFGPGVRATLDRLGVDLAALVDCSTDDGVRLLRPPGDTHDLAVLQQEAPGTALLDTADRLAWLAGAAPAPDVLASGRNDDGDETLVIRLPAGAGSASHGHPMGPEALADALAAALTTLHARPVEHCPFSSDASALRRLVDERVAAGAVEEATDGPYAARPVGELVGILDGLLADLGDPEDPVFVHAGLAPDRIWLDPAGGVTLLGWRRSGVGDRHVDLAAAALLLSRLHGPALVGPFVAAYGIDRVDVRRLDAHQLLVHLLS